MNVCILQPSYIPWRGYFHQIQKSDVFVFYDDIDYDARGWRNRNRVKTRHGVQWLTIPVKSKGRKRGTPIHEMEIDWETDWIARHWTTLTHAYARAPHFERYAKLLEPCYRGHPELLADFTTETTQILARALGSDTKFLRSSEMGIGGRQTARLIEILRTLDAHHYITGPSAKGYIEEDLFEKAGIELEYMVYDYPEYEQLYPPYDPQVSILDTLFMLGPDAPSVIW